VDIVKAAFKASEHQHTTLIGEDTDLLIVSSTMLGRTIEASIFVQTSPKKKSKYKVFNISEMKQVLGSDLCSQLLFIHV